MKKIIIILASLLLLALTTISSANALNIEIPSDDVIYKSKQYTHTGIIADISLYDRNIITPSNSFHYYILAVNNTDVKDVDLYSIALANLSLNKMTANNITLYEVTKDQIFSKTEFNGFNTTKKSKKPIYSDVEYHNITYITTSYTTKIYNNSKKYFLMELKTPNWQKGSFNFTLKVGNKVFWFIIEIDPDVSACGNIYSSGYYVLTQNIGGSGNNLPCISIGSVNNVDFDCRGYSIRGNGTYTDFSEFVMDVGVTGTQPFMTNITIRNCILNDSVKGAGLHNIKNLTFYNNTIINLKSISGSIGGAETILLTNITDGLIDNNTFVNITNDGSDSVLEGLNFVEPIYNLTISNNYFSNHELISGAGDMVHGIWLEEKGISNNVTIKNNRFNKILCDSCRGVGIYVGDVSAKYITIFNNTFSNSDYGIIAINSSSVILNISNNLVTNATEIGISIGEEESNAYNATIEDNIVQNSVVGITIHGANNTFKNNNITGSIVMAINDSIIGNNTFIYENNFGRINWSDKNNFTVTSPDLIPNNNIFLNNNLIGFAHNSSTKQLNTTAQLTFYGLNWTQSSAQLLKDGVRCNNDTKLCNITYVSATGTLYANVSSFSNYTTNETVEVDVYNFSLLFTNTSHYSAFRFFMKNIATYTNLFNWSFNTGISNINNTIESNLATDEKIFVFVEHNYSAANTYTVEVNGTTIDDVDSEELIVTVK